MATFKVSQDSQRKWRWALWSDRNNRIIAVSSESYQSKQGLLDSIDWVRANARDAELE